MGWLSHGHSVYLQLLTGTRSPRKETTFQEVLRSAESNDIWRVLHWQLCTTWWSWGTRRLRPHPSNADAIWTGHSRARTLLHIGIGIVTMTTTPLTTETSDVNKVLHPIPSTHAVRGPCDHLLCNAIELGKTELKVHALILLPHLIHRSHRRFPLISQGKMSPTPSSYIPYELAYGSNYDNQVPLPGGQRSPQPGSSIGGINQPHSGDVSDDFKVGY